MLCQTTFALLCKLNDIGEEMVNKTHLDPRVRRTRKLLQESLLTLLKTKRLDKIQIKEIAEHADVSRHAFYTHFESKEDLLFSYCDDFLMPLQNEAYIKAHQTGDFDLEALLNVMFEHWVEHRQVLKWVMQVENKDLFIDRLHVPVSSIVDQLFEQIKTDKDTLPLRDYIADFMTGGIYMLLRRHIMDDMLISTETISRFTYQISMSMSMMFVDNKES